MPLRPLFHSHLGLLHLINVSLRVVGIQNFSRTTNGGGAPATHF